MKAPLFLFSFVLPGVAVACGLNAAGIVPGEQSDASSGDAPSSDVNPSPDAATDADADTGPMLTNWCSTRPESHDFCADFDTSIAGSEPGAWCAPAPGNCTLTENNGSVTLDTTTSTSPPNSAKAETMADAGAPQAFLTHEFPGDRHGVTLAFDVRVDAVGTDTPTVASIKMEDTGGESHRIALTLDNVGALSLVEFRITGSQVTTPLSASLPIGTWTRVEMSVGIGPNVVDVSVAGVPSNPVTIDGTGTAMGRSVQLGLDVPSPDSWQIHIDDVTFDFTK